VSIGWGSPVRPPDPHADRLAKVEAGSAAADQAIHEATRQAEPVLPYTTDEALVRVVLPPSFEWMAVTPMAE
jgi:hypothetical protein